MQECIFCKIISGKIPCDKVYENEDIICFLDIAPINLGHTLVIPKEHHSSITCVPSDILAKMTIASQKIGRALQRLSEYDGFNIHLNNGQCAGQDVMHTHFHIIPRVSTDKFFWNWRKLNYQSQSQKDHLIKKINKKLII